MSRLKTFKEWWGIYGINQTVPDNKKAKVIRVGRNEIEIRPILKGTCSNS